MNEIAIRAEGLSKEFRIGQPKEKYKTMRDTLVKSVLRPWRNNQRTTNSGTFHALKEVQKSLTDIKNGLNNKLPGDLLALDIRRCLHYLGEITGEVNSEDLLDYIFSKFCIGK